MDIGAFKRASQVGIMAYLATTGYRLPSADQLTVTKEIKAETLLLFYGI